MNKECDVFETRQLGASDDLGELVAEINRARWDDQNAIEGYEVDALRAYLAREGTVFVVCHDVEDGRRSFVGMASGRVEQKPYAHERWLYVDEVDVAADQRRRGVGRVLMEFLFEHAETCDCREVWLATEAGNDAANALYRSLRPSEVEAVVGYAFAPRRAP